MQVADQVNCGAVQPVGLFRCHSGIAGQLVGQTEKRRVQIGNGLPKIHLDPLEPDQPTALQPNHVPLPGGLIKALYVGCRKPETEKIVVLEVVAKHRLLDLAEPVATGRADAACLGAVALIPACANLGIKLIADAVLALGQNRQALGPKRHHRRGRDAEELRGLCSIEGFRHNNNKNNNLKLMRYSPRMSHRATRYP
jgi:hypothetical protein